MRSKLGDKTRLQHIQDSILEIESYVQESSYENFQSNTMMQFACVKQLEIIGEAANHLTPHFKNLNSEVQWREIIDLRNLLIHEYFGIDTKIVWDIIKVDLVSLKSQVLEILQQL